MRDKLPFARTDRFSASELRRLRDLRDHIKIASVHLPRALLRDLLGILEGARPWQVPSTPIPEMTRAELLRAIRWRLGTIPPSGAQAAAAFVARHRRRPPARGGGRVAKGAGA